MIKFIGIIIAELILAIKNHLIKKEATRVVAYSKNKSFIDGAIVYVKPEVLFELLGEENFKWIHMNAELQNGLVHQNHGVIAKLDKLELAVSETRPFVIVTKKEDSL